MNNKTFCETCRAYVEYRIEDEVMRHTLKDKEYVFNGKEAYCTVCNSLVWVHKINDYNLKALYDVYRKENNIVPLEKIKELPDKYSIGKRGLSLLLGWGENTFTRYYNGGIPNKQYSDIIAKLYDEPEYYLQLLEKNKDELTQVAYEKSFNATQKLLDASTNSKIEVIAGYLINNSHEITNLALQKVLYYVQAFSSVFSDNFIFQDDCQAWVLGPVYKKIYNKYSKYGSSPIKKEPISTETLTAYEKAICDSIIKNFCCYSGGILASFTHKEAPWLLTRDDLPPEMNSERVINKQLIREYFVDVKNKYNMINPGDIQDYAQDMFNKK